jgi:hypothetical protein
VSDTDISSPAFLFLCRTSLGVTSDCLLPSYYQVVWAGTPREAFAEPIRGILGAGDGSRQSRGVVVVVVVVV